MIEVSSRLNGIGEYYFSQKLREIEQLNQAGKQIINLGIGSPDLPPHPSVIQTLQEEAARPDVHAYQSYKGSPILRKAMSKWYQKWYGVTLDPDQEILPLIGSKEGIMHVCMTYLNEGDIALVPNPGYPTYRSAVKLAGGTCVDYNLTEEENWQPDFHALEAIIKANPRKVKLMWVNYPHMPTGQLPDPALFEAIVQFGKKHGVLICHDNPYSFILNDRPASLLAVEGAKEVVIELNSLSKSHNMAGWRVGILAGSADRLNEVMRFKSNMDSGMFLPAQLAAAKALQLDDAWYRQVNATYRERQVKAFEIMELLSCTYATSQAGMFVWGKVPAAYKDSYALSDAVLYDANVFITPGGIFGKNGEAYIRISLCSSIEKLTESKERIQKLLVHKSATCSTQ